VIDDKGTRNVVWYRPDGQEMDAAAWSDPVAKVVGLLLCDSETRLLLLTNAYHEAIGFMLPPPEVAGEWQLRVDTASGQIDPENWRIGPAQPVNLEGRSLMLFSARPA
jgi:isoamylase